MADRTAKAESSQALFCAIGDNLGTQISKKYLDIIEYKDYNSFKKALPKSIMKESFARIKTPGVSQTDIDNFLNDNNDWYKSSVNIAKKLIEDITKIDTDFKVSSPGFESLYYFRGDKKIMGNIEELFKIANTNKTEKFTGQIKFGNINKWSPADIYFATRSAKFSIAKALRNAKKPKGLWSFDKLNILINDLIDTGDLLPLSLKKKSVGEVVLQKVNFNKNEELDILKKVSIKNISVWNKYKINSVSSTSNILKIIHELEISYKNKIKMETRDIKVFLKNNGEIKLRHDPSAARFVAELIPTGGEAKAGSIGSIKIFCELMSHIDSSISTKILNDYKSGEIKFNTAMKSSIMVEMKKNRSKGSHGDKKEAKIKFDFIRGGLSALYIINEIMPTIQAWFGRNDSVSKSQIDDFIRLLWRYVTSRSPLSGKFVIAK
jgi:hypothetical protein